MADRNGIGGRSAGRVDNKIKDKLRKTAGETLVETLVAMLIVVLPFLSLAAAVMTSTRINYQVKNNNTAFLSYDDAKEAADDGYSATYKNSTVTFTGSGTNTYSKEEKKVSLYIIEKEATDLLYNETSTTTYIYYGPQEYK